MRWFSELLWAFVIVAVVSIVCFTIWACMEDDNDTEITISKVDPGYVG